MKLDLEKKPWWGYLEHDLQELMVQSETLCERVDDWEQKFHDYSFIVFPAAKAYEGFLKKLFLDLGFITKEDYMGKRFRIGRALNPEIDRKEGVYLSLQDYCGREETPKILWEAWRKCRNRLFHWFADEVNAVDYPEAKKRIMMIVDAMDHVFMVCKTEKS